MPKVVREDIDNLNISLAITVGKEDIDSKLKTELNKHRSKASMKGFRKGKTPLGLIKKMYGKSVMAEIVNELVQKAINDFIQTEKLDILGFPIPSEDQAELDFDVNNIVDLDLKFDIGLAPQIDVAGIDNSLTFEKYEIDVNNEMIDKDLDFAAKRMGTRVSIKDDVAKEDDIITFNAEELEGDSLKENGWATTFDVLVSGIEEAVRKDVLGKKVEDKVRFNIYTLEGEKPVDHVKKYLLNVPEGETQEIGENFEGIIADIKRVVPAEMNQEFFDKYFGEGKVNSVEEAREMIQTDIQGYYKKQIDALLYREVQSKLIEENSIVVPEAFLKRWLVISNQNLTAERVDTEYPLFEKDLKWTLIRGNMLKKFNIEVSSEEVLEAFKERIRAYFGGAQADELVVLNTANRMMEDKKQAEQVFQELESDKLFAALTDFIKTTNKKVTNEEFDEIVKQARAASIPPPPPEEDESIEEAEVIEDEEVTENID